MLERPDPECPVDRCVFEMKAAAVCFLRIGTRAVEAQLLVIVMNGIDLRKESRIRKPRGGQYEVKLPRVAAGSDGAGPKSKELAGPAISDPESNSRFRRHSAEPRIESVEAVNDPLHHSLFAQLQQRTLDAGLGHWSHLRRLLPLLRRNLIGPRIDLTEQRP